MNAGRVIIRRVSADSIERENHSALELSGLCWLAEITSSGKGYPTEVAIGHQGNLQKESYIQLDNIQTVAKTRFEKYIGTLDSATMRTVARKVILALGLEDAVT